MEIGEEALRIESIGEALREVKSEPKRLYPKRYMLYKGKLPFVSLYYVMPFQARFTKMLNQEAPSGCAHVFLNKIVECVGRPPRRPYTDDPRLLSPRIAHVLTESYGFLSSFGRDAVSLKHASKINAI